MRLRVLGTAAGGGAPQWNCACPGCAGARANPAWRRRHASLAVEAAPGQWYVVNATPDIGEQIEAHPELQPPAGSRRTPIAGVVLTDAEIDHTLGLPRLREGDRVEVLATPAVRAALCDGLRYDAVLGPYVDLVWHDLKPGQPVGLGPDGAVLVEPVPISDKRPRYAADLPGAGNDTAGRAATAVTADIDGPWVVALRLTAPASGRVTVYAPCLAVWPDALDAAVADADCVIVDGTFWDEDEPQRAGFSSRTASAMGHLPMVGPTGTAERLAALPAARKLYTHLNNTNPLVDPDAPGHATLAELGIEVAAEGMEIDL